MKTFLLTLSLLFAFVIQSFSQYTESFDISNRGIIAGPCSGSDGTTCASNNFSSVDWTIDGNLSGIDTEGLFTKSGYLHFEDVDEESCWVSPILDISATPSASVNVDFTIPSGTSWESSTTVGSQDYMDVKYSVDNAPFTTLSNVNGCPGSGHTLSGIGCAGITGPYTANINQSGITGNILRIRVCVDTNASSDDGWLEEVSVPEAGAQILPVTWSSVNIEETSTGPKIKWSTVTEENSDIFEIERMNPETNRFEMVGQLKAAGYSTEEINYEFTDSRYISNNLVYYRIKQIDFNGEYSYSEVVSLRINDFVNNELTVFPNPTFNSLQIDASTSIKDKIKTIKVYNTLGALEFQSNVNSNQDRSSIDVSLLSSGIYFIQFEDENQVPMGEVVRFYKLGN